MPGSGGVLSPELRRPIRKIFTDTMISNDMERYAVGADIGGSHICSAVVDLTTGEICGEPLSGKVDCDAGAGEILGAWADNIRQSIAASGLKTVRRVGFAFPGPFDYEHGVSLIRGVNKFYRIYGLDISESLFPLLRRSGAEEFRYVNDASAFALGECLGGAACDARRVVALTLGTGVGSGFVSDRKLVTSGDEVPADGWVYCLPFGGGIVDEAFSTRGIIRRYEELTGETLTGARDVAARYDADPAARRLFDVYGEELAQFAGPVLTRFNADVLVLGGNISRAYPLFGPALERRFAADGIRVAVRTSALLDHAAMIGAASLFL